MNRAWILLGIAVSTAGCSGIPRRDRDKEQLDRYLQYAGAPIDQITYLGHSDGWYAVSPTQLVFWTNINDAYLITVRSPCENLQFSQRIAVTQTVNTISARFDAVLVRGWRCQISEIRPIDYLRMKRDLREEHAREKAAAAAAH